MRTLLKRPIVRSFSSFVVVIAALLAQPKPALALDYCGSVCASNCAGNNHGACQAEFGGTCGIGATCGPSALCGAYRVICYGYAE